MDARALLLQIREVLWPDGDGGHEWAPEHMEEIAEILQGAGLFPRCRGCSALWGETHNADCPLPGAAGETVEGGLDCRPAPTGGQRAAMEDRLAQLEAAYNPDAPRAGLMVEAMQQLRRGLWAPPDPVADLCQQIGDRDVSEALDDLVHEAKGEEAAGINNDGVEAQVRYLIVECGNDPDLVRQALDEAAIIIGTQRVYFDEDDAAMDDGCGWNVVDAELRAGPGGALPHEGAGHRLRARSARRQGGVMKVYLRFIHKVSQNPEADIEGPFEVENLTIDSLWARFKGEAPGKRSRRRGHEPRLEDGGAVFFLRGIYHAMLVMPVGSDLHRCHAPPSHFAEGGPLHEERR